MVDEELPRSFRAFLEPDSDRFCFLDAHLRALHLSPATVELAGSRHIVVAPGRVSISAKPRIVLAAHYDRAPDSPGANDNSAAVFQLAEAAVRLRADGTDGWLIVFTDREEAAGGQGARGQGAYALAEGFKAIGLGDARFFIFDACGRGDTIIVSTTVGHLAADVDADATGRTARELRLLALETGRVAARGRILLAPTPFSDDAGFLAAGIAAQTITLLPAREAAVLARNLRCKPDYAAALINKKARDSVEPRAYRAFMPATWRNLHGAADDAASLSPSSFALMERFTRTLVRGC